MSVRHQEREYPPEMENFLTTNRKTSDVVHSWRDLTIVKTPLCAHKHEDSLRYI